uniref:Uncharacterized protein n=1 Tax=Salix viminalis TaxID=40686 RepID=A0A6N2M127_SALVM
MKVKKGHSIAKKKVMIPDCEEAGVETLFQKSIEHIMKLKLQVHILKSLLQQADSLKELRHVKRPIRNPSSHSSQPFLFFF